MGLDGRLSLQSSYVNDRYESVKEQVFPSFFDVDEDLIANELVYEFGPSGRVKAGEVAGLVGLGSEERRQDVRLTGTLATTIDVSTSSQSAFTDLRYGLTDSVSLLGGLRIQRVDDERVQSSRVGPVSGESLYDKDETVLLPSLGVAYAFDELHSIGVSLRRGYNPGGGSVNFFTGQPYVYDSETVWTAEATYRGLFFDERLSIGLTGFYNLHDNPQVYGEQVPGDRRSLQIVNQERGRSYGLELEGALEATDRLTLTAGLGLLRTEITEADPQTALIEGNRFGQDPSLTASIGGVWTAYDWLSLDAKLRYAASAFNDFNNVAADRLDAYALVDIGATAKFGHVDLRAYVNNVFDETAVTRRVTGGFVDVTDPLTAGLTMTARF
ncbi:TonB-dependent receptor domain-containing protein [Fulvimarina manganoxydans]|uniref:TonB-dependent receptor domain-containing protein n=1 Tax=Fulvimarina manganoxydans TaxID=937218 RepID=UPI001FCCF2B9|nr:TonB-dependent receptor [Fulvimarina manganoxydans]